MGKKNKPESKGYVYSTDPEFKFDQPEEEQVTLAPAEQRLRVKLDAKARGGKTVTLVRGFEGRLADLEKLGKELKNYCGTGGSVKDGEIIVQGDQRAKVIQFLLKKGYGKVEG